MLECSGVHPSLCFCVHRQTLSVGRRAWRRGWRGLPKSVDGLRELDEETLQTAFHLDVVLLDQVENLTDGGTPALVVGENGSLHLLQVRVELDVLKNPNQERGKTKKKKEAQTERTRHADTHTEDRPPSLLVG